MKKEYLDFIDFIFETGNFKYANNIHELAQKFRKKQNSNLSNDDADYLIDYFEYKLFEHVPGAFSHIVKLTAKANTIKREYESFTKYNDHINSEHIESKESTFINTGNIIIGNNNETVDQSSSSSNSNLNSQTTETISNNKPKKPPTKSVIEIIKIIGVIIGILSGIVAIYKFWIE